MIRHPFGSCLVRSLKKHILYRRNRNWPEIPESKSIEISNDLLKAELGQSLDAPEPAARNLTPYC